MGNEVQALLSAVIQILLFTLLPFIWWLVTARRKNPFLEWIGLKPLKDTDGQKTWLWILLGSIFFLVFSIFVLYTIRNLETAMSRFSGLGFKALPSILIYSIFQTALPEEILFRGFLLKRLASRLPFRVANTLQAALFGLLHGLMFASQTTWLTSMLIILFTGGIAAYLGFVNEKKSDGSILSSWGTHALANIFAGLCSAFMLI